MPKCPNCGAEVKATDTKCLSCWHVLVPDDDLEFSGHGSRVLHGMLFDYTVNPHSDSEFITRASRLVGTKVTMSKAIWRFNFIFTTALGIFAVLLFLATAFAVGKYAFGIGGILCVVAIIVQVRLYLWSMKTR